MIIVMYNVGHSQQQQYDVRTKLTNTILILIHIFLLKHLKQILMKVVISL